MKKVLLKVNKREIENLNRDLEHNLKTAQQYVDWRNGIEFCEILTGIKEIKEFLSNPQAFYETEVRTHLAALTGLKTLPANIHNLIDMYEIPECQAYSVSDKLCFEFLQVDENGKLFYDATIYEKIEADNTLFATPEQARTLKELDRTFNNLEKISEFLYPESQIFRDRFIGSLKVLLEPFLYKTSYHKPHDGTLIKWDIQQLNELSKTNFSQSKN